MTGTGDDHFRLRGAFRDPALWTFVALVVLLFLPALTTRTFYFADLQAHFFPIRRYIASVYRSGQLPLWNPLIQGGMPLLADPNNLALYPTIVIWFCCSAVAAFNIELVLHVVAGGVGAFLLARDLKLSSRAAFVAASVYAFCGFTLSLATMENRLFAAAWIPFVILFARRGAVVEASLAGAVQVLAGAPEACLLTWLTAFVWVAAERRRWLVRTVVAALLAALIAAVQIVPTLTLVGQTNRAGGVRQQNFWEWSVHPKRLPELFVPAFLGDVHGDYWGRTIEDNGAPYIASIYFGLVACALALAGMRARSLSREVRITLAALTAAFIVLSLGRFVFGSGVPPPLLRSFRFPVKALTVAPLTIGLLAAAALDDLARVRRELTIAAIALTAFAACAFLPNFASWWFGGAASGLHRVAAHAVVAGVLLILAIRVRHAALAVAALTALDLMLAALPLNPTAPRALFNSEPPAAGIVKRNLFGGRLYADVRHASDPFGRFARLEEYTGAAYGIPTIFHIELEGLEPLATMAARDLIQGVPWPEKAALLRASGVSVVISDSPHPELAPIARGGPVTIYTLGIERPAVVYDVVYESGLRAAIGDIASGRAANVVFGRGTVPPRRGEFRIQQLDEYRWRVATTAPGFFLMNIPFDRDWGARVDGHPATTLPANFATTALPIGAGTHEIEMHYAPWSVTAGGIISALALAGALVLRRRFGFATLRRS